MGRKPLVAAVAVALLTARTTPPPRPPHPGSFSKPFAFAILED